MVDHFRWSDDILFLQAQLTDRILLEFDRAEPSPLPALVELGVVMSEPLEGLALLHPRTVFRFLDGRHGGAIV